MKPDGCDKTDQMIQDLPQLTNELMHAPSGHTEVLRYLKEFTTANPYFYPDGTRSDKVLCAPSDLETLITKIEQLIWNEAARIAEQCVDERTKHAATFPVGDVRKTWLECKGSEAMRLRDYFQRKSQSLQIKSIS